MRLELRPSTLEERKEFYEKEFSLEMVSSWFVKIPQFFVIDLGTETRIIRDKNKLGKLVILEPGITLSTLKRKLMQYIPEDVYYDRNQYKDIRKFREEGFREDKDWGNLVGQQLVFDIDPENFNCKFHKRFNFTFCESCQKMALHEGRKLYLFLEQEIGFKNLRFVYSGRGCHIHVFDKGAYKMSVKERTELNEELKSFKIDPWVSQGCVRLIKVPYSLNAVVSRVVSPLNIKDIDRFNPMCDKRAIPRFLKDEAKRFQILRI